MVARQKGSGHEATLRTMEEVPAELRPRDYGKHEILPVALDTLIMVSQQRGSYNPAFGEIKDSIDRGDVINIPDVAFVRYDAFVKYIDFVNRIWGSNHSVDDYAPDEDGYYHLVAAGHTRAASMIELEVAKAKKRDELGFGHLEFEPATSMVNVYRDLKPEEILALQMDENLHEKPLPERSAIAMVETYLYGLEIGQWADKNEFIEKTKNKFSLTTLNQAVAFCRLHQETREFVFTGAVPYSAAVEVGKSVEPYMDYVLRRFYRGRDYSELSEAEQERVQQDILMWTAKEVAYIQGHSLRGKRCRERYQSYRANWRPKKGGDDAGMDQPLFTDIDQDYRDHVAQVRKDFRDNLRAVTRLPVSKAGNALQLYVEIFDPSTDEGGELLETLESTVREFDRRYHDVLTGTGNLALAHA